MWWVRARGPSVGVARVCLYRGNILVGGELCLCESDQESVSELSLCFETFNCAEVPLGPNVERSRLTREVLGCAQLFCLAASSLQFSGLPSLSSQFLHDMASATTCRYWSLAIKTVIVGLCPILPGLLGFRVPFDQSSTTIC